MRVSRQSSPLCPKSKHFSFDPRISQARTKIQGPTTDAVVVLVPCIAPRQVVLRSSHSFCKCMAGDETRLRRHCAAALAAASGVCRNSLWCDGATESSKLPCVVAGDGESVCARG